MMIGAVLTQNTSWKNVEKAILNLKKRKLLSFKRLRDISPAELSEEIRPAGYYNIKADRIKHLIRFIAATYNGNIKRLINDKTQSLRQGLLAVKGIGHETADSILLYAARKPVFVIDAYTHRILVRHGMAWDEATYQELQELFMDNLPEDSDLFNEFHALIVETGKDFCRKKPRCENCPLKSWRTLSLD
jgi:endonuclease-3 related protein